MLDFWLKETGCLTQRLGQLLSEPIQLKLLQHRWQTPTREEASILGLTPRRFCLVREVILHRPNGESLVFARSIIPKDTLTGRNKCLLKLGERSLGSILFSDPTLQRSQPEPVYSEGHWGRRSIFRLRGKPLLVSEYFL